MWKNTPTLGELNKKNSKTLMESLGISFTAIDQNSLEATMPVDKTTIQPFGLLHGGASCALGETLGSVASSLCIDLNNKAPVGLSLQANHIRSAKKGHVTGVCTPDHLGRTTHIWNIDIFDEEKRVISKIKLTVLIKDKA